MIDETKPQDDSTKFNTEPEQHSDPSLTDPTIETTGLDSGDLDHLGAELPDASDLGPEIIGFDLAHSEGDSRVEETFGDLGDPRDPALKSLSNTDVNGAKKNVADLVVYGQGDTFKLICKASSEAEGWMKSTKAMQIEGIGCVVQVTTQQHSRVAEALTFVPGVRIDWVDRKDHGQGRKLVSIR